VKFNIISLAFVVALCPGLGQAFDRDTAAGYFEVARGGKAKLNGQVLLLPATKDGAQPVVSEEWMHSLTTAENRRFSLLSFWGRAHGAELSSTHFVILEFFPDGARVSNALASNLDVQWVDNNYSMVVKDSLHFGVFAPKRMQFVYKDGKLEEDKGPWKGPPTPEKYIEPDKSLPCANVANVPDCLAEVERDRASRRQRKMAVKRAGTAASAAASESRR
jgi:hypothetical protein